MSDEELDDEWLESYKILENDYNDFYKKNTENIEMYFFYINSNNELESINKMNYILDSKSKITKNNMIKVIKENEVKNNKKYKVKHIVKYNITLEPDEIIHMLKVDNQEGHNFMSQETYSGDIHFSDTVCILQDLNSLYIIFSEVNRKQTGTNTGANTRKIKFRKPMKTTIDKTRRKRV